MNEEANHVGRKIRALRRSKGMTQRTLAGLAGFNHTYVSQIENGHRAVERRSTLEAVAAALRVSPSEITSQLSWPAADEIAGEARAATGYIAPALADFRVGDSPDSPTRPWNEIAADLRRLDSELRPRADYAGQGHLIPRLIEELHSVYGDAKATHRTDALIGLTSCYHAAAVIAKNTGVRPVAWVAADRLTSVAERLSRPEHTAHALWVRTHMIGGVGRERQVRQANRSLDALASDMSNSQVMQAAGQLHLTAALAHAALLNETQAWEHLSEADTLARHLDQDAGEFGYMWFGRTNTTFWRVSFMAELGQHDRIEQVANSVDSNTLPDQGRQAQFYSDYGRALAQSRRTREKGVRLLRRAEDLAPQLVRNNPLVRESALTLLGRRLSASAAREVRGLAYRTGAYV